VYKAWGRDKIYFIDTKLQSFKQGMNILCADDINMSVSIKWLGSFKVTPNTIEIIKSKIPAKKINKGDMKGFELSLKSFYDMAVHDIVSSITRTIVSKYKTDNIKDNREVIRNTIKKQVLKRLNELSYPLETADILITNLDYPTEVTAMRKRIKQAQLKDQENSALAKAEVAKAERDAQIAKKKGEAELIRASLKAKANKIKSESLTKQILMARQIEAISQLANGKNNTVFIMPYDMMQTDTPNTLILSQALKAKASK
jgi:regulator of protease activity HflC (stomatin/prohibitin superfamily)